MAYLLHTYVAPEETLSRALQSIVGLGSHQVHQICDEVGFTPNTRVLELHSRDWDELTSLITTYYVTGQDIRRRRVEATRRLIAMGTYRGFRHVAQLPVRGQRTHSNARTQRRGPRMS